MIPPLKVLIVDDELLARDRLISLLGDILEDLPTAVVGSVADGLAAIDFLSHQEADVAFIDIRMPRMDGIELAGHLGRYQKSPSIIFTTAYDDHAVQAFELNAVDYLLKPIRAERLLAALRKVSRNESGGQSGVPAEHLQGVSTVQRRYFSCMERGKILLVPVSDVLFLRATSKYVVAQTTDHEYLLDESLNKLEEEFDSAFLRLHRAVLVAKSALVGFEKQKTSEGDHWVAKLRGFTDTLPVSRRQWPTVKKYARFTTD